MSSQKLSVVLVLLMTGGCAQLYGLDAYRVGDEETNDAGTTSARSCADDSSCPPITPPLLTRRDDQNETTRVSCDAAECAVRPSEACPYVVGNASDPRSVRIGAVFDLSGLESSAGQHQVRAAELAAMEINAAGGVARPGDDAPAPLTIVICDVSKGLRGALDQLVGELGTKAIITPPGGVPLGALVSDLALPDDVVLLTPGGLLDGGLRELTFGMGASESDRVPMLMAQLTALEQLSQGESPLRIALVLRTAGPTSSARIAQATLQATDNPGPGGMRRSVSTYSYLRNGSDLPSIVSKLAAQPPDIILTDGGSEVAFELIAPLELALQTPTKRPSYLLTEAAQAPALLTLAALRPELMERTYIVASTPTKNASPVHAQFEDAYRVHYASTPLGVTGVAASYAAVYALTYGLMAAVQPRSDGAALAEGLRALGMGELGFATSASDVTDVAVAFNMGRTVSVTGTLSDLDWTAQGSPTHARVGTYCIGREGDRLVYRNNGFGYDIETGKLNGAAARCTADEAAAQTETEDSESPAADSSTAPTPPEVPSDAPAATDLAALWQPTNLDPLDGVIAAALTIVNRTSQMPVPLCTLALRYYFSNEQAKACPSSCSANSHYAALRPSGTIVASASTYHAAAEDGADDYMEITFPCPGPDLALGDSVETLMEFEVTPPLTLDESNDYSFDVTQELDDADSPKLAIYQEGRLVWGTPSPQAPVQ